MCPYTTAMLINQAIINCIFVLLTLLSLPQANGRTIWQFEIEWQSNRTTIVDNWQFKDMYVFLIILQTKDIEVWDWCSFLSYQKSRVCMPCYGMFADIRTQSSLSIFSYNYQKHFLLFFLDVRDNIHKLFADSFSWHGRLSTAEMKCFTTYLNLTTIMHIIHLA